MKESGEMYLESIYVLQKKNALVRSIDVAEYMNFSKPSVSRAVGILKKDGYITIDGEGYIRLTNDGLRLAKNIYERHTVLTQLLSLIGVDSKTAEEDACRIEHIISEKTFDALKAHLNKHNKGDNDPCF